MLTFVLELKLKIMIIQKVEKSRLETIDKDNVTFGSGFTDHMIVCEYENGNIRDIDYVVLVGGSALDFEIPQMVTEALSHYGVVAGKGNIRGVEGPRNAVATGLALSYKGE